MLIYLIHSSYILVIDLENLCTSLQTHYKPLHPYYCHHCQSLFFLWFILSCTMLSWKFYRLFSFMLLPFFIAFSFCKASFYINCIFLWPSTFLLYYTSICTTIFSPPLLMLLHFITFFLLLFFKNFCKQHFIAIWFSYIPLIKFFIVLWLDTKLHESCHEFFLFQFFYKYKIIWWNS